jgi:hypothetical protein
MTAGVPHWRRQAVWLNVAGLLDFAVAIGTGVLTSNTSLGFFASDAPRATDLRLQGAHPGR